MGCYSNIDKLRRSLGESESQHIKHVLVHNGKCVNILVYTINNRMTHILLTQESKNEYERDILNDKRTFFAIEMEISRQHIKIIENVDRSDIKAFR